MSKEQKIVKDWFTRWLMDFRIYSPLYKIEVGKKDELFGDYIATAKTGECSILVGAIRVNDGTVGSHSTPLMYRGNNDNV